MKRSIIITVMGLLLSACSTFTGAKQSPQPQVVNQVSFTQAWKDAPVSGDTKQYTKFTPTLVGNMILLADDKGHLAAVDKTTGKTIWHSKNKIKFSSSAGYGDGKVYIGTDDATLLALNAQTGKTIWQQKVSDEIVAKPAYGSQVVVVKTLDGKVFALSSIDGTVLWQYVENNPELVLKGESDPLVQGHRVLAGFPDGKFLTLNLQTGELIWDKQVADSQGFSSLARMIDITAMPIVDGDIIYVATYQGNISALSLATGERLWEHELSTYSGLANDAANIYVTDSDGVLWAFNKTTGSVNWKQSVLQNYMLTGPVVYKKFILLGDNLGNIQVFAKSDGQLLGREKLSNKPFYVAPMTDGNTVYMFDSNGKLTALQVG